MTKIMLAYDKDNVSIWQR